MSRPLICSGQWSQTTTGIIQPAARLSGLEQNVQGFVPADKSKRNQMEQMIAARLPRHNIRSARKIMWTPTGPSNNDHQINERQDEVDAAQLLRPPNPTHSMCVPDHDRASNEEEWSPEQKRSPHALSS